MKHEWRENSGAILTARPYFCSAGDAVGSKACCGRMTDSFCYIKDWTTEHFNGRETEPKPGFWPHRKPDGSWKGWNLSSRKRSGQASKVCCTEKHTATRKVCSIWAQLTESFLPERLGEHQVNCLQNRDICPQINNTISSKLHKTILIFTPLWDSFSQ